MAAKDIVTKDYIKDAEIFADAFNYLMFEGNAVIQPSKLHELDTTEIGVPYGRGKSRATVQKFRDSLKYLTAMEDENAAYLLLGIENQSDIHYAMAVKNMVYDALQYASQVEKAAISHRDKTKKKSSQEDRRSSKADNDVQVEAGEYLSGFYKGDRLLPVITLVLLFNPDPWDAPMSIHDMLSVTNPKILSFVPDYRINLIAPAQIEVNAMDKFKSSLREVLLYIKYSKNKEQLKSILENDPRFKELDLKAAIVIDTVTNSKLKFSRKEKKIDMCQAITEMREEERLEGTQEEKKKTALRMLKTGKLAIEEIAEYVELSVEEINALI